MCEVPLEDCSQLKVTNCLVKGDTPSSRGQVLAEVRSTKRLIQGISEGPSQLQSFPVGSAESCFMLILTHLVLSQSLPHC